MERKISLRGLTRTGAERAVGSSTKIGTSLTAASIVYGDYRVTAGIAVGTIAIKAARTVLGSRSRGK